MRKEGGVYRTAGVLNTDEIIKSQQTNAAQALAGRVVGVQISNSTGEMGAQPSIVEHLFVMDGIPYTGLAASMV